MEKITSKMDSVFDDVADSVTDFDVMFDEDDHLVDLVEGFASNGKPLTGDEFDDIHLSDDEKGDPDSTRDLDDDCNPDDIKKTLGDKDDLFGASEKDVENGSEWEIGDNNKEFKSEKQGEDEKWFEDSDKKYQDSDFKGSVDPSNINKSLEAEREAAMALEEAMAFLEADDDEDDLEEDSKKEDKKEEKENNKDKKEEKANESFDFDFLEEETFDDSDLNLLPKSAVPDFKFLSKRAVNKKAVHENEQQNNQNDKEDKDKMTECGDQDTTTATTEEAAKISDKEKEELKEFFDYLDECEDTVHDDMDSTKDITDNKPSDKYDIEDEDDPKSRDDDTETDDGVGALEAAIAFLESDDNGEEGMLADNDEAEVHSDVQCDGTENCQCPMCKEKKLNDSELAVGDTFKESAPDVTEGNTLESAIAFLEADDVDTEEDTIEDDAVELADDDSDEDADVNLDYDISDEDIIDAALNDDDF